MEKSRFWHFRNRFFDLKYRLGLSRDRAWPPFELPELQRAMLDADESYAAWTAANAARPADIDRMRSASNRLVYKPVFSIVLGIPDVATQLERALRSIRDQAYPHWQIIVATTRRSDDVVRAVIERVFAEAPASNVLRVKDPIATSRVALLRGASSRASGAYVAFLDPADAFAPDALWAQDQQMFRSRLRDLVRADFSENSPISALLPGERRSVRQEAQFGDANRGGRGKQVILDGAAGPLRAQGFIDRMDEANGRVFVIDYKSGSQKFKIDDMVEGRNVQMYVYVLAAQALVKRDGHTVIGGAFWHVSDRTLSGAVSVEADQEALTEAAQNIHAQVIEARQGHFPNTPSKREGGKCARYCEFSKLCRVAALD